MVYPRLPLPRPLGPLVDLLAAEGRDHDERPTMPSAIVGQASCRMDTMFCCMSTIVSLSPPSWFATKLAQRKNFASVCFNVPTLELWLVEFF